MSALGWIILAVCVVALVIVAGALVKGIAAHSLRRRFGPEYDRAVEQSDDRQTARRRLAEIARRRDELDVRPLDARERGGYVARWEELQTQFVDDPAGATGLADALVADVMHARGYPETGPEERAELISADRPEFAGYYRAAHAAIAGQNGDRSTEDLRSDFVHYRELFRWLVDGSEERRDRSPALSGHDRPRA